MFFKRIRHRAIIISMVKASIVLITYNRAWLLKERSLPSALNQTFNDFEVIVVDDCSNDETEQFIAEEARKNRRLRYVRHENNKGGAAAHNTGVRHAVGEYVVFLDDDDALEPNFLAETIPVLAKLPREYGALSVGVYLFTRYGKRYILPKLAPGSFYTAMDNGWLMRKRVVDEIAWDEEMYFDYDAVFGIEFFKKFKAGALDKPLFLKYDVRQIGGRRYFSSGLPHERRLRGLDSFVRKYLSEFENHGIKNESQFIHRYIGSTYVMGGEIKKGISFLLRAFRIKPSPRNFLNVLSACFGAKIYAFYWRAETGFAKLVRVLFQ